ncbi:MAG: SH3 domain-containing protein, partial [Christensenellales bacterium]|nr:SH3 domain-containing protein [Christensenellales bacterium]
MICIYSADCTDFTNNGLGVVVPTSCSVTETLNGEWELTLEHPIDDAGKWRRLVEGRILRVPVPAASTPRVNLVDVSKGTLIYRVVTSGGWLYLRSDPSTKHRRIGSYKPGTEVIVLNKTNDEWYETSCPDGKHGFMHAQYLKYVRTEPVPGVATGEVIEARQLRDQPFRIYRTVPDLTKVTVYA